MTERERKVALFQHLTEVELPARAHTERWPIRLDHCFKRICLDAAFGDVWYAHLQRPAERHIDGAALDGALAAATALLQGGRAELDRQNTASLRYRGKPAARSHVLSKRG